VIYLLIIIYQLNLHHLFMCPFRPLIIKSHPNLQIGSFGHLGISVYRVGR